MHPKYPSAVKSLDQLVAKDLEAVVHVPAYIQVLAVLVIEQVAVWGGASGKYGSAKGSFSDLLPRRERNEVVNGNTSHGFQGTNSTLTDV